MLRDLKQRIKRRETPLDDWLYRVLVGFRSASVPTIGPLHRALFRERIIRRALWDRLTKGLYYEPLFRSQCASVGRRFRIENAGGDGMPPVSGGLEIHIGDDVTMMDRSVVLGVDVGEPGQLTIGNATYLGADMLISVAREITIGNHCLIGAYMLTDNPGHPIGDTVRRVNRAILTPAEVRPVTIGDYVWLATGAHVYPGCRIGDGVVALPGTHIAGMNVPPFTLVSGNPGRIRAKLPLPKSLIDLVGEERYEKYRAIHKALKI